MKLLHRTILIISILLIALTIAALFYFCTIGILELFSKNFMHSKLAIGSMIIIELGAITFLAWLYDHHLFPEIKKEFAK